MNRWRPSCTSSARRSTFSRRQSCTSRCSRERAASHRPDQSARLEADLRKAVRERDNLIAAIAQGNPPASLITALRTLDARIADLEAQLAEPRLAPLSQIDRARMKRDLHAMLGEFNALLDADIPLARQVLRKTLDGRIEFDSSGGGYVLSGRTKVGALFPSGYIAGLPRIRFYR
jgi:hypothetical protein